MSVGLIFLMEIVICMNVLVWHLESKFIADMLEWNLIKAWRPTESMEHDNRREGR